MTKTPKKATNLRVTQQFLDSRIKRAAGFPKAKWIEFCEVMLDSGMVVYLYEARKTYSKYITVTNGVKKFVVRFSNHPPIRRREENGDCDFFVGHTNFKITTTDQAIAATAKYFQS